MVRSVRVMAAGMEKVVGRRSGLEAGGTGDVTGVKDPSIEITPAQVDLIKGQVGGLDGVGSALERIGVRIASNHERIHTVDADAKRGRRRLVIRVAETASDADTIDGMAEEIDIAALITERADHAGTLRNAGDALFHEILDAVQGASIDIEKREKKAGEDNGREVFAAAGYDAAEQRSE